MSTRECERKKTKEEEHIIKLTRKIGDDNILYFPHYFKKKYMEYVKIILRNNFNRNGINFDVSHKLRSRIKHFGHEINKAAKRIEFVGVRKEQSLDN